MCSGSQIWRVAAFKNESFIKLSVCWAGRANEEPWWGNKQPATWPRPLIFPDPPSQRASQCGHTQVVQMIQSLKNSISTVSERPIFYIYPPLLTILSWIYYPDLHCCRWGQVDVQQKGNNQVQKKKKKEGEKKKKRLCPGQRGWAGRSASRKLEQTFVTQITLPDSKLRFQTSLSWTAVAIASSNPLVLLCVLPSLFLMWDWSVQTGVWEQTRF